MVFPLLFIALLCLPGCQFHLRPYTLPEGTRLQIHGGDNTQCIEEAFHSLYHAPSSPAHKTIDVFLATLHTHTIPITFNSFNQLYQQELQLTLSYHVDKNKKSWLPKNSLRAQGEQRISNSSPLSDQSQEQQLRTALCQRLAQQLFLQIQHAHAHSLPSTPRTP
jgi:outer membrane lipopolysaccharide assembly protein LptE/RlpB